MDPNTPATRKRRRRHAFALLALTTLSATLIPLQPAAAATTMPTIDVRVTQTSSELTVNPRGDREADRIRENRAMQQSTLEPTSRYVRTNEKFTVTLPAGTSGVEVAVGQYGVYAAVNGGTDVQLARTKLTQATTTLTSDRDGLIWLSRATGTSVRATVSGGAPVPTFIGGVTSEADFRAQLSTYSAAPFAIVAGKRVVAAFQRGTVTSNVSHVTSTNIARWDTAVDVTDATYGLDVSATGVHRKSPALIHIANPDTGSPGSYASATYERITFQNDTGAGRDLLVGASGQQWGLWHEIGHTYQTPQYTWDGLGEVTVNISSLAVQKALGYPNELAAAHHQRAIQAYLAKPDSQRDYDGTAIASEYYLKLGMFDALHARFGDDFFPKLNRLYRERAAAAQIVTRMQQTFKSATAEVARTDLTDFFTSWGVGDGSAPLEQRAVPELAQGATGALTVRLNFSTASTGLGYEITAPTGTRFVSGDRTWTNKAGHSETIRNAAQLSVDRRTLRFSQAGYSAQSGQWVEESYPLEVVSALASGLVNDGTFRITSGNALPTGESIPVGFTAAVSASAALVQVMQPTLAAQQTGRFTVRVIPPTAGSGIAYAIAAPTGTRFASGDRFWKNSAGASGTSKDAATLSSDRKTLTFSQAGWLARTDGWVEESYELTSDGTAGNRTVADGTFRITAGPVMQVGTSIPVAYVSAVASTPTPTPTPTPTSIPF